MFKTAVFLSIIFAVIFKGNSLQCYVCYDCEKLSDDYLTSCDSMLSTTTTTAQPTSTRTSTSTSTNTTPSPTTTSTESTTTSSTTTNTTESTTSNSTTTSESTNSTTTTTTITPSTTTTSTTTEAPQLQVSDFARRLERANTTWECVKGTIPVNGSDVIVRGCAAGRTNETCDMFGLSSCSFCSSDKCNSAGSIQASAAVLAVVFFAYIVKDF